MSNEEKSIEVLARDLDAVRAAATNGPLRVLQREGEEATFLMYATDNGIRTELRFDGGAPWFTQAQLAEIFGTSVPNVNEHIAHYLGSGEINEATFRKFRIVRQEGNREVSREIFHYGLDVAFYVGYRVNTVQGALFRRWATAILVQIAINGYFVDVERLRNPLDPGIVDDLTEIIRFVRSSTTNAYRQVRKIVSMCQDYDGRSETAREFYMRMENRLLFVATGKTAPEIIRSRANANSTCMGLTYFDGKRGPTKEDVKVANNYLDKEEAETKNRITVMLLDFFEDQLKRGRLVTMQEAEQRLISLFETNGWPLLEGKGKIKGDVARDYALDQHAIFLQLGKEAAKALSKPSRARKAR